MKRDSVKAIIIEGIEIINNLRELDDQVPTDGNVPLFGDDGYLDSMTLVALLIDVEESLQDNGCKISLSTERAMSEENSPFKDVESLVDYVIGLLPEGDNG